MARNHLAEVAELYGVPEDVIAAATKVLRFPALDPYRIAFAASVKRHRLSTDETIAAFAAASHYDTIRSVA